MGGWGSGRREYATTPTVEECHHLDADDVNNLTEHLDTQGVAWWGDREDPAATITVATEGERDLGEDPRAAKLRLQYTITDPDTGESEELEYSVRLDYTECNFGGYRPWFRCPGVVDGEKCGRRVRKLYLPRRGGARYYLCRECYDLGYQSSRTSGDDIKQAELRYRRAFAKADAEDRRPHPNTAPYSPDRPKGMHRDTFDDLLADVREAEQEWANRADEQIRGLLAQYAPRRETRGNDSAPRAE